MTAPPPKPQFDVRALARRGALRLLAAGTALAALGGVAWRWWRVNPHDAPTTAQPAPSANSQSPPSPPSPQSPHSPTPTPTSVASPEHAVVERIVDLLVPRDATPGALDLGLQRGVIEWVQADATRTKAVAATVRDLDSAARASQGGGFMALDAARQIELLQALAQATRTRIGGHGFVLLREETMAAYYARPEAWPSLGFAGPPQPLGFLDYTDPPRRRV